MEIIDNNIKLRSIKDDIDDYTKIYEWYQNINVYEWFEQRKLTLDEVIRKYKNKIYNTKQTLLIIEYDDNPIGLIQFYEYPLNEQNDFIEDYNNLYEFDLFIGDPTKLSKGIGTKVINMICNYLFDNKAERIVLRPFKSNERAVNCYKKCGFKEIGEYKDKNSIGKDEITLVLIKNKKN